MRIGGPFRGPVRGGETAPGGVRETLLPPPGSGGLSAPPPPQHPRQSRRSDDSASDQAVRCREREAIGIRVTRWQIERNRRVVDVCRTWRLSNEGRNRRLRASNDRPTSSDGPKTGNKNTDWINVRAVRPDRNLASFSKAASRSLWVYRANQKVGCKKLTAAAVSRY